MNIRNSVRLIGTVRDEPEIRSLSGDVKLARLTMTTIINYPDRSGKKIVDVQAHAVVGWDKIAEIIEASVVKGSEIVIEGTLAARPFEDKDGERKYLTEVTINEILLLGKTQNPGISTKKKEQNGVF